jgi:DNA (cytosine-5)-methyltransferase 1
MAGTIDSNSGVSGGMCNEKDFCVAFTCSEQANSYAWERPFYPTITAQQPSDSSNIQHGIRQGARVRRLLPVECERLMGLPDGYTEFGASGKRIADSARYRMLGNGWSVPQAKWLAERVMRYGT